MKCVIVFVSCVLAAASAPYGATSYSNYKSGAYTGAGHAVGYNLPIIHGYAQGYSHGGNYGAEVRLVDPVAVAAGAPLPVGDTYEVTAAKAAHFKAHAIARERLHSSPLDHGHSHTYVAPVFHGYTHAAPIAHGYAHGYSHASSVAHGYTHASPVSHGYADAAPIAHGYAHGGQYRSEARLIDPVAIAAGAPLPGGDTYEVAAAKAAHAKAHAAAKHGHLGCAY